MATSQQFLVCDNSTLANFKSWASAVSNILRTFGWTNTADTGQLNGAGAGNWASVASIPGSSAFYYEIFKPGDALTPFYLKLEYGNGPASNSPTVRISIGTGTDGAGNLSGFVSRLLIVAGNSFTAPSTTTTYECDFSGTSSRLSIMLWRNAPNAAPQAFAIQRSLNSSGSETSTYATVWGCGNNGNSVTGFQQTVVFGIGPAPYFGNGNDTRGNEGGFPTRSMQQNTGSMAFNNSIPIDCLQPYIGFWDYPCTAVGVSNAVDIADGVTFSIVNQYGQTKTYMPGKLNPYLFCNVQGNNGNPLAFCMEYD